MALFDKKQFDHLIGGDKELFVDLLKLFATDYPAIITDLRKAIGDNDTKKVEILAHRLRGMVRNFFAAGLAREAETIEDGGREGDISGAGPRLEALAVKLKQLESELALHLKSLA